MWRHAHAEQGGAIRDRELITEEMALYTALASEGWWQITVLRITVCCKGTGKYLLNCIGAVGMTWLSAGVPVQGADAPSTVFQVQTTSGDIHEGRLQADTDTSLILISDHQQIDIPITQIWQFSTQAAFTPRRPKFWLHLTNGDRWGITAPMMIEDQLVFEVPHCAEPVRLELGYVAGLQPCRPKSTWRTDDPDWRHAESFQLKSDLVVLRNGDRPIDEISEIGVNAVSIQTPQGIQSWEWPTVQCICLDPELAEKPEPLSEGYTLLLADESWVTAAQVDFRNPEAVKVSPQIGSQREIPWTQIRWVGFWGEHSVPLSQLPISRQKHEPQLGTVSRVVVNRNVLGMPMRLRSTPLNAMRPSEEDMFSPWRAWPAVVPLGIGLTSGMTAEWILDGAYRQLLCGVAFDATACERGHVEMIWKTDNHPPVSLTLDHGSAPQWRLVDVTGSQSLQIEIHYGEQSDICDFINLLAPVLVK